MDSSGEEETVALVPDDDSEDEIFSDSDETSTRQVVSSMSTPSSAFPSTRATPEVDEEEIKITSEFENRCGCSEGCYEQFSITEIREFRLSMMELTKIEWDMFLMGKLHLIIRDPGTVSHARSSRAAKKQWLTTSHAFDHRIFCQKAFCYLHDIGEFTLRALRNPP